MGDSFCESERIFGEKYENKLLVVRRKVKLSLQVDRVHHICFQFLLEEELCAKSIDGFGRMKNR